MIIGSASSSPYSSPNPPSKQLTDLQGKAISDYYCDASINYDLLPSVRNRVLFFAGMKVRADLYCVFIKSPVSYAARSACSIGKSYASSSDQYGLMYSHTAM